MKGFAMYSIKEIDKSLFESSLKNNPPHTIFTSKEWISFLEKNQNGRCIVLELSMDQNVVAYFVGLIIRKIGFKILGSPFNGWLTPDMGFVCIKEINYSEALKDVVSYVFTNHICHYLQICDKNILSDCIEIKHKVETTKLLMIDLEKSEEDLLSNFTKNGRRDVRASGRKGVIVRHVEFDKAFADIYYDQLIDVFAKQNLTPHYSRQKVYDLVDAFKDSPDSVIALEALNEEGEIIATVFSFGYGNWAYYVGAASFRDYQKLLPNEALFWEFVLSWKRRGVKYLDLMGYREYKMKYNPVVIEIPRIIFEKIPGIFLGKEVTSHAIGLFRGLKGLLKTCKKRKKNEY